MEPEVERDDRGVVLAGGGRQRSAKAGEGGRVRARVRSEQVFGLRFQVGETGSIGEATHANLHAKASPTTRNSGSIEVPERHTQRKWVRPFPRVRRLLVQPARVHHEPIRARKRVRSGLLEGAGRPGMERRAHALVRGNGALEGDVT